MTDKKFPDPEDLQKEFEDFVHQRFGGQVQVFTNSFSKDEQSFEKEINKDSVNPPTSQRDPDSFKMTPKDIKDHLDRFVIKQDDAKKALAIAVCDHYNNLKAQKIGESTTYHKQNVLVLGPTGVGKTYLVRKIADLVGVPFVKADATRFSETGYVGANVDDMIRDLVTQADGDIERAQNGIVYIDEADKLASSPDDQMRQVNGRGVQFGLLRLMEDADVDLKASNDIQSQIQAMMDFQKGKKEKSLVNTKGILFIISGAFNGLEEIISKRLNQVKIGFGQQSEFSKHSPTSLLSHTETEDLIKYGLEPEFVGRLPVRVSCDHLGVSELFSILKDAESSIVDHYISSFKSFGIDVSFEDDALLEVARQATYHKTGARALQSVLESALREFKFELPSAPHITRLTITQDLIQNPIKVLEGLLIKPQSQITPEQLKRLSKYEQDFKEKFDLEIRFSPEAAEEIGYLSSQKSQSISDFCDKILETYEHGLKLLQQSTGQCSFYLEKEIIEDPLSYLEKMIQNSLAEKSTILERKSKMKDHADMRH